MTLFSWKSENNNNNDDNNNNNNDNVHDIVNVVFSVAVVREDFQREDEN